MRTFTFYAALLLTLFFIPSCGGDNRNEIMTSLINKKKAAQDSISHYKSSEALYKSKVVFGSIDP
jgi:hypothetical protein